MCLMLLIALLVMQLVLASGQVPPDVPDNSSKPNVIYYNTGKTTEGSTFLKNVEAVIRFLYENNPPNGFATSLGYGEFPDTAYGHSGCYNMSDQTSCASCIQQAYLTIQRTAPLAVGGVYWMNSTDNRCRIRYESYNFTNQVISLGVLGVLGPNASVPTPAPTPEESPSNTQSKSSQSKSSQSKSSTWGTGATIGVVLGGTFLLLIVVGFLIIWRRYSRQARRHRLMHPDDLERSIEGPIVFKYKDLSAATNNFSDENKLGEGGFGIVYRAYMSGSDGGKPALLAVKKLTLESGQGNREFVNEINVITSIQHRNLVRLTGYCVEENEKLLVYEYMEKGSLDRALFGHVGSLFWQARFQIAVGVARGLAYLHEESHVQIIHRDIKASNILLDEKLQPKISDFGISKLFDMDKGYTSTNVAGTRGYMAPEYVTRGKLTSKADVFSYGVLALEIVSGRTSVDSTLPAEEELLVPHTWNLWEAGKWESSLDSRLGGCYVHEEAYRLIHVAVLCTQENEESRPVMSDVVAMLLGYLEIGSTHV